MRISSFLAILLVLAGSPADLPAQQDQTPLSETEVRNIAGTLLARTKAVVGFAISAAVEVADECGAPVNACTQPHLDPPRIYVTPGMLSEIINGDTDLLAFILGHEIGHIVLKDRDWPGNGGVVKTAVGRDLEAAADSVGMMLAVAAGYSYRDAVRGILRLVDDAPVSTFEHLRQSHPSWWDRAAFLNRLNGNRMQARLWRAMGAFQDGVYFLGLQQHQLAERAFEEVVDEFPGAYEAWANLGYARLMRYCDGLELEDLQQYELGHLVTGAFYERSESLRTLIRGIDTELWWDAVGALREALRIGEQEGRRLTLARANLGIAYLVHPSGKRDLGVAARHLETALSSAESDSTLTEAARASIVVNHAVALLAGGEISQARDELERTLAIADDSQPLPREIVSAITYNQGLLSLAAGTDGGQAAQSFETFLMRSSPSSVWWREAYRLYVVALGRTGAMISEDEFRSKNYISAGLTLVTSVKTEGGELSLNQPTDFAATIIPDAQVDTLISGTNVVRVRSGDGAYSVVGNERVLAITLNSPEFAIPVQSPGSEGRAVKVGSTRADFQKALGDYASYYEPTHFLEPGTTYFYYRDLGLAALFNGEEVAELIIVQIPSSSI